MIFMATPVVAATRSRQGAHRSGHGGDDEYAWGELDPRQCPSITADRADARRNDKAQHYGQDSKEKPDDQSCT